MPQYKVEFLPCNIVVSPGQGGSDKAAQLIEARINQWASQGFELDQITQIAVIEPPGCLAGLLGQKATSMEYNVMVFKTSR